VSSTNAIGTLPLVAGLFMCSRSFESGVLGSPSVPAVASLVGGSAGVLIGVSVLAGWGEFDTESSSPDRVMALGLVAVSLLCFGAGVVFVGL